VSLRGADVESVHLVSAVVVNDRGDRVAWCGDPARPTHLRSAAKPFQAIPLVADGVIERFGLTPEELALACASHNSEPRQVALVSGVLARLGLDEAALACGPHRPLSRDLAIRAPDTPPPEETIARTPLSSNCSGKHAGMLALALHHGWATDGYESAGHPVQNRCRAAVAMWTGVPEDEIGESVDGCGVVCFRLPLAAMALGFARLGTSAAPEAEAIRSAMMGHPDLVAGKDRLCTALMGGYPGEVVAKVGADGVYGAALPHKGLGVALKVEDGDARAAMAALLSVLDQIGVAPAPTSRIQRFAEFPIQNTRRRAVGVLRADGDLTFD